MAEVDTEGTELKEIEAEEQKEDQSATPQVELKHLSHSGAEKIEVDVDHDHDHPKPKYEEDDISRNKLFRGTNNDQEENPRLGAKEAVGDFVFKMYNQNQGGDHQTGQTQNLNQCYSPKVEEPTFENRESYTEKLKLSDQDQTWTKV